MNNKLKVVFQQKTNEKKNHKIEAISKKLIKIEKLKVDIETLKTKITTIRQLVDEKTTESKNKLCQAKEKFVIALIDKYVMKSFSKREKEIIISIINQEIEALTDFDYRSIMLDEAIIKFIKLQKESLSEFEMEMAQEAFESMLDEFDIELDGEDLNFDFEKMNDPAYKKRIEEKIKEKAKENHDKQMQLEKEKKIAKTDIDFQKIYKKLAKMAHPDLHQSETEKTLKEEVMQRLTTAWDERNYYDLLMLWLEIDPENSIELEITESNQKNIIAQLNETIGKIENEIYQIKFYFHETSFYYQFNAPSEKAIHTKIGKYIKTLDKDLKETALKTQDIENVKNFKKTLNKIYKSEQEEEQYMNAFFNSFGGDNYDDDDDDY
jgi:hypothetical protein